MNRLLVASVALAAVSSCQARRVKPSIHDGAPVKDPSTTQDSSDKEDLSELIQKSEREAAARDAKRVCKSPIPIFEGSITVNSSDYQHSVARGEDFVDEPISGLDRVLSKSAQVRFTLDYPFERPFAGVVTGDITLRRTIDAIRAGFRQMYQGTTQRDIPGTYNKDVMGPYGRAFHVIDDLVIARILLCEDDTFLIVINS
jgi:hypothetical protein